MTRPPRRLRERQIGITERATARLLDWGGERMVLQLVQHLKNVYPTLNVKRGHWARERLLINGDEARSPHVILHPWSSAMFRAVICVAEEGDLIVANAQSLHGTIDGVSPLHPISTVRQTMEQTS